MAAKVIEQAQPAIVAAPPRDIMRIIGMGVVIGLVMYALYVVLDRYVFTPTLCGEAARVAERCASKGSYASALATLVAAIAALVAAVRMRVYRPLLVVLLATAAVWGILAVDSSLAWWMRTMLVAAIVGVAYGAFAWLARVRNIYAALALSLILLVLVRLVLSA